MVPRHVGLVVCAALLAACAGPGKARTGEDGMKVLQVRWQRLVDEKGRTCDRCGATEAAVDEAVGRLGRSLKELGVKVVLAKTAIDARTFLKDPLESNRIWIGGRPVEDWLQGSVGKSRCCSACGDSDCRTVTVDGKTYEDIPAELIVRAGLLAGAQLLGEKPRDPCCPPADSRPKKRPCCPPSGPPKGR